MSAARPKFGIEVLSTGSALPAQAVDNRALERAFGLEVAAAAELAGVERRFWAVDLSSGLIPPQERTSELCARAARAAFEAGGLDPAKVDLLVLATYTPDYPLPGTLPYLLRRLGIGECTAFELRASCSGLGIALTTVAELLRAGSARTALILCAEINSLFLPIKEHRLLRQDRLNLALFSDGASAIVLRAEEVDGAGDALLTAFSRTLAPERELPLLVRGGGAVKPASTCRDEPRAWLMEHDPKELETIAPAIFQRSMVETLDRAGVKLEEVNLIIPPQANGYLYGPLMKQEKPAIYFNVGRYGNTTSASIGIALDEAVRTGRLKRGDLVMLLPFSAAKLVCSGALIRWTC